MIGHTLRSKAAGSPSVIIYQAKVLCAGLYEYLTKTRSSLIACDIMHTRSKHTSSTLTEVRVEQREQGWWYSGEWESINQNKSRSLLVWDGLHPRVKCMHFSPGNYNVAFMNVWEPPDAICVMIKEGPTVWIEASFVSVWDTHIVVCVCVCAYACLFVCVRERGILLLGESFILKNFFIHWFLISPDLHVNTHLLKTKNKSMIMSQ